MLPVDAAKVLQCWFGSVPAPDVPAVEIRSRWFEPSREFDTLIRARFGGLVNRALDGELVDWEPLPRTRLALVLLLDQFTRNIFRDSERAFAGDARAAALARDAIATGVDKVLTLCERSFLYLPFEHAEDHRHQALSLRCFQALLDAAAPKARQHYLQTLEFARRHERVISRFGRFPHRNRILGRTSTVDELAFLESTPVGF